MLKVNLLVKEYLALSVATHETTSEMGLFLLKTFLSRVVIGPSHVFGGLCDGSTSVTALNRQIEFGRYDWFLYMHMYICVFEYCVCCIIQVMRSLIDV